MKSAEARAGQVAVGPGAPAGRTAIVLWAALIVYALSAVFMAPFVPDDAYVDFRYAENVASGHGVAFNPGGPPVEGCTSMLWVGLGALLAKAGLPLPSAMPFAGALFGALSVLMLWTLYRRRGIPGVDMSIPLLLFASAAPFVTYAISGLETPLFAALLLVLFACAERFCEAPSFRRAVGFGLSGALLAACRTEGVVAFPIAAAMCLRRSDDPGAAETNTFRRNAVVAVGSFLVIVIVYELWRTAYFGSFLPASFGGRAPGGPGYDVGWIGRLKGYFVKQEFEYPPFGYYYAALVLLALIGIQRSRSSAGQKRGERAAMAAVIALMLVYTGFHEWMPGLPYHAALIPLIFLAGGHVTAGLSGVVGPLDTRPARLRLAAIMGAAWLVHCGWLADARIAASRLQSETTAASTALGEWLSRTVPQDSWIACEDVGALTYASRRSIIDLSPRSITDPEVAGQAPTPDAVFGQRSEVFIVVSRGVFTVKVDPRIEQLLRSPLFGSNYRFLGTVKQDWFHDRTYRIYFSNTLPRLTDKEYEEFPEGIGSIHELNN
jgi:arabinofuranosyltransferase